MRQKRPHKIKYLFIIPVRSSTYPQFGFILLLPHEHVHTHGRRHVIEAVGVPFNLYIGEVGVQFNLYIEAVGVPFNLYIEAVGVPFNLYIEAVAVQRPRTPPVLPAIDSCKVLLICLLPL